MFWYFVIRPRDNDGAIRLSGNIETTEVNISFKIPGRVEERLVDEGDKVRKGQVVAKLDKADLEADVAVRRAELLATQAALAELEAGSRPEEINASRAAMETARARWDELKAGSRPQEIEAAKAELAAARIDQELRQTQLQRDQKLYSQGTITPDQYDQTRAVYKTAIERHIQAQKHDSLVREGPRKEQIDQAKATFDQAEAQYKLVKEGPRKEVIEQARAKVEQAKASLQVAETRLGYATVTSPLNGVVLSKNTEPGEYVAPGTPVVTIADLNNVWLRAYVDEGDLGTARVKWGQEADVSTDAYPGKVYKGRISFISSEAEFTPKTVQTEKERVKLVYRIKIDIDNPNGELKPGMPADAVLRPIANP